MPTMELDPVHMASKLPTPFQADDLLQGQGASTLQILQEAINMSLLTETGAPGLEGRLQSSKVMILSQPAGQAGGEPLFELPLLAAHVCAKQDRLAIAPTTMGKLVDVWVFKVQGGEDEMETVLRILARCGAIRYDLPSMYALGSKLSAGSMSSMYRAQLHGVPEDPSEANVAIKVTPKSESTSTHKRVARELELHHACHNHPNVSKLIAAFQVDEKPLGLSWAMAVPLPSQDLMDCVLNSGADMMAAYLMKGLLGALQHLHKQDIVYRKVSPENIFLTTDMKPLLSDFSLAMRLSDLKRFPIQLGHPGYTAPEILLNMEPTLQSDIFSAGAVLYFLMAKRQPFADDVATAIQNNIKGKVPLDQEEFNTNPKLKDLLEGLMERSPASRLDAPSALAHEFVQQAVPVPHAPPGDPNARSQRLRQRFVKMLPGESSPAPSVADGEDGSTQEEVSKSSMETDWRLSFSELGRHEALVYRRRYLFSSGTTKSFLQIIPFSEVKDLQETSHTIWQTLELEGCLQVPLDGLDTSEPYSPAMLPLEPAHLAMMAAAPHKPGAERVSTSLLRTPDLPSAFKRQTSGGSQKNLRIDSTSLSPMREGEESGARGQPTWWMHSQQAHQLRNPNEKVSRDMFGTCAFSQSNEDGHRRRFVKKLGMGEQEEEDFDDTASWQSWRSEAMLSSCSRSRGRSGSMASCISNASAAAMRELLMANSEDESERDFDALGPPAGAMLSHRGSGMRGSSPHLSVPGEQPRRPILTPQAGAPVPQPRDWGTCQFRKEVGPGGKGRQKVRPIGPAGQQQLAGSAEEDFNNDASWQSFADIPRSLSQASVMSDMSFAVGPSPSGDMMKDMLLGDLSPSDGPSGARPRRSSRRGTNHQLQDLYRLNGDA